MQKTKTPRKTVEMMLAEAEELIRQAQEKIAIREEAGIDVPPIWREKVALITEAFTQAKETGELPEPTQEQKEAFKDLPTAWRSFGNAVRNQIKEMQKHTVLMGNFETLHLLTAAMCLQAGWPVCLESSPDTDLAQPQGGFLLMDLPTGQVSFRLTRDLRCRLASVLNLPTTEGAWDKHRVAQKTDRLEGFYASVRPTPAPSTDGHTD